MSDPTPDEHAAPRIVDITAWIERARRDPLTYVERQATEVESLDDAALVERARSEWSTLEQDIGELPDFDLCLEKTQRLYRSLPWDDAPP